MTGGEIAGIIGAVSALANVFLGWWGMAKRKDAVALADGVKVLEHAIDENKHHIEKIPGGAAITATIKDYGPVAEAAVDAAREIADTIARERYVNTKIEEARNWHAECEEERKDISGA